MNAFEIPIWADIRTAGGIQNIKENVKWVSKITSHLYRTYRYEVELHMTGATQTP